VKGSVFGSVLKERFTLCISACSWSPGDDRFVAVWDVSDAINSLCVTGVPAAAREESS
jgi:hypothetical protein